jgi:hypothetical protein
MSAKLLASRFFHDLPFGYENASFGIISLQSASNNSSCGQMALVRSSAALMRDKDISMACLRQPKQQASLISMLSTFLYFFKEW